MSAKCALRPRNDPRHYLTLRPGQYWGFHVDLRCSHCKMTVTTLKSDILSASDRGPIQLKGDSN